MTIEENLQNIENDFKAFSEKMDVFLDSFAESLDDLKKQIKTENTQEAPAGLWKPEAGEKYWYIYDDGVIGYAVWRNDCYDTSRYVIGNCYPTQEAAEKALEHKKIRRQLEEIAARLNKGRKIDWDNIGQNKYNLFYDWQRKIIDSYTVCKSQEESTIYCLDGNFKDAATQEIGEDRLKEYLKEC